MIRWLAAALVVLGLLGLGWWLVEAGSEAAQLEAAPSPVLGEESQAALARAAHAGLRSFEGLVVDASGAPVPDATVAVFLQDTTPEERHCATCAQALLDCGNWDTVRALTSALTHGTLFPTPLATTRTGPDGRYRVGGLPDLPLHFVARAGALAGSASGDAEALTVQAGVEAKLLVKDFQERPVPGAKVWVVLPGLLEARRLTSGADGVVRAEVFGEEQARVLLEDPRFVPQASVMGDDAMIVSTPHSLRVHTRLAGQVVDADMRLELHGDPTSMRAAHGELRLDGLPQRSVQLSATSGTFTAPQRDVALEGQLTEVTLELRAGGRLLLTVIDDDGQPVKGASASLDGADSSASSNPIELGAMQVLGPLAEGEYTLLVSGEGMRELRETIDLLPGDHQREVTLRRVSVLRGRVVDANGPVAQAEVSISAPGVPPRSVETDQDGTFSLNSVPLADALVTAQHDTAGRTEVHTRVPGTIELHLEPRASVRVLLRDARGRGLIEALATLSGGPGDETVSVPLARHDGSNEVPQRHARGSRRSTMIMVIRGSTIGGDALTSGAWSEGVRRGLEPGTWKVDLAAQGLVGTSRKVTLVDGQTTELEVTLDPGVCIEGRVLDGDGAPIVSSAVFSSTNMSAVTDESGHFILEGLAPGKVSLTVSGQHVNLGPLDFEAPARDVVLRAPKQEYVTGRVVDPAGRPVSAFEVNGQSMTDPSGVFSVILQKGRLAIFAKKYELLALEKAHGALGDLVLRPSPQAEGDVVAPDGLPVAGARVRSTSTLNDAVTGADGRFVLELADAASPSNLVVVATRGAMMGQAALVQGGFTHVVLGRGTRVVGRVLASGKSAPEVDVAIESAMGIDGSRSVTSDGAGAFEVMLWPGTWNFTAAGLRVSRAVEVTGDRAEVELGGQLGRCALEISGTEPIESVTLEPLTAAEGGPRAGTVTIDGQRSPHLLIDALPCETFTVTATHVNSESVIRLSLEAHTAWNGQSAVP